jgi:hypothetical protein
MKTKYSLEELFALAQNQPSMMDEQKAMQLLNKQPKTFYKTILMKTIILSGIIASTFWGVQNFQNDNQEIQTNELDVPKSISEKIDTEISVENGAPEQSETMAAVQTSPDNYEQQQEKQITESTNQVTQTILNDEPTKTANNKESETNLIPKKSDELSPNTNAPNIATNDTTITKEECIVLSKEELAKLGIFVKDGNFMFDLERTAHGRIFGHITKDLSISYTVSRQSNKRTNNFGQNALFYFVSTSNCEVIFNLTDKSSSKKFIDTDSLKYIIKNLIPIWVELDNADMESIVIWYGKEILDNKELDFNNHIDIKRKGFSEKKEFKNFKYKRKTLDSYLIANPENQIINPEEELLRKLGFSISKNSFKYKRKNGFGTIKIISNKNKNLMEVTGILKGHYSNNIAKIIPLYISKDTIKNPYELDNFINLNKSEDVLQRFLNDRPLLIGLRVLVPNSSYFGNFEKIFWYHYTDAIAKELDPETRARVEAAIEKNKQMKADNLVISPEKSPKLSYHEIAESPAVQTDLLKTLSLSTKQLQQLGIEIINNNINYQFPSIKKDAYTQVQLTIKKTGTEINYYELKQKPDTSNFIFPVMVTDIFGKNKRLSFGEAEVPIEILSNLIPVKVLSGNTFDAEDLIKNYHHPDLIFWYEPNEKFLHILDNQTAAEIKQDIEIMLCKRNQQILEKETECETTQLMTCKYFESCENSLDKNISTYKVYPNPAKDYLNVNLNLVNATEITFKIQTIDGKLLHNEKQSESTSTELNKILHISRLSPGMYLLVIETAQGDKIVERFVVSE